MSVNEELNQNYKQQRLKNIFPELYSGYYDREHSLTPEEVVCKRESLQEITEFLITVRGIIGEKRFEILWLYAVEKWTHEKIAEKYNVSRQAITKQFKIIEELVAKNDRCKIISEGTLIPPQSTKEMGYAEIKIGFPWEYLMDISDGGEMRYRNGRKSYRTKSKCAILDYFKGCFKDSKTLCGICFEDCGDNKCRNKENLCPKV